MIRACPDCHGSGRKDASQWSRRAYESNPECETCDGNGVVSNE